MHAALTNTAVSCRKGSDYPSSEGEVAIRYSSSDNSLTRAVVNDASATGVRFAYNFAREEFLLQSAVCGLSQVAMEEVFIIA